MVTDGDQCGPYGPRTLWEPPGEAEGSGRHRQLARCRDKALYREVVPQCRCVRDQGRCMVVRPADAAALSEVQHGW